MTSPSPAPGALPDPAPGSQAAWPPGDGPSAAALRAIPWSETPLGPPAAWPALLRALVCTVLGAIEPTALLWGAALVQLHNDAYARLTPGTGLGQLGAEAARGWSRVWGGAGPVLRSVLRTGHGATIRPEELSSPNISSPDQSTPFSAVCMAITDDAGQPLGVLLRLQATVPASVVAAQQHQVGNMMAVMRSIVRRTAQVSSTPEAFASHLDGRLDALARIDLRRARDPAGGVDLEMLAADELMAVAVREDGNVLIRGPAVRLRGKAAELLGLALHELAVNAMKFGVFSGQAGRPGGRLSITWSVPPASALLRLSWQEDGMALPPGPPPVQGFGTEILSHALPYQLGAETAVTLAATGLHCRIDLPLSPLIQLQDAPGAPGGA